MLTNFQCLTSNSFISSIFPVKNNLHYRPWNWFEPLLPQPLLDSKSFLQLTYISLPKAERFKSYSPILFQFYKTTADNKLARHLYLLRHASFTSSNLDLQSCSCLLCLLRGKMSFSKHSIKLYICSVTSWSDDQFSLTSKLLIVAYRFWSELSTLKWNFVLVISL